MTPVEREMHAQYPNMFRNLIPRLARNHPKQVQALIVQNGNVYKDGLPECRDWQRSR